LTLRIELGMNHEERRKSIANLDSSTFLDSSTYLVYKLEE